MYKYISIYKNKYIFSEYIFVYRYITALVPFSTRWGRYCPCWGCTAQVTQVQTGTGAESGRGTPAPQHPSRWGDPSRCWSGRWIHRDREQGNPHHVIFSQTARVGQLRSEQLAWSIIHHSRNAALDSYAVPTCPKQPWHPAFRLCLGIWLLLKSELRDGANLPLWARVPPQSLTNVKLTSHVPESKSIWTDGGWHLSQESWKPSRLPTEVWKKGGIRKCGVGRKKTGVRWAREKTVLPGAMEEGSPPQARAGQRFSLRRDSRLQSGGQPAPCVYTGDTFSRGSEDEWVREQRSSFLCLP